MRTEPLLLGVRVAVGPDGDAEELAEATRQVRRELHARDVEAVRTPTGGDAPAGGKGLGPPQRSVGLEFDGDLLELTDEWLLQHGSRQ
jgi:hypothetical protein